MDDVSGRRGGALQALVRTRLCCADGSRPEDVGHVLVETPNGASTNESTDGGAEKHTRACLSTFSPSTQHAHNNDTVTIFSKHC